MEEMLKVGSVQEELAKIREDRDTLYSAKMKVEETIDEKDAQIAQLQVEVQRHSDDVTCRKMIIEQLTK